MKPKTFKDVIALWPSQTGLAGKLKVKPNKVILWNHRNSIPPEFWWPILKVAKKDKIKLEAMDLVKISHSQAFKR